MRETTSDTAVIPPVWWVTEERESVNVSVFSYEAERSDS